MVSKIKGKLKKNNVNLVEGLAEIMGKSSEGYEVKINNETFTGKRLLIATGSMPVIPPIPGTREGLETGFVLTNREILDIKAVPASLVIVGGGVIGLEMASYFNSAGSKVTVIEMLDHIAGYTDGEIADILLKNYQKKGVEFKLGAKVVEIREDAVVYEINGQKLTVEADKVLMSIGRRPVTEGLGLETIGVELERGRIKTDEKGKTNIPEVYAAGDVNGYSMLAHTAYREAEVCINNILGKKDLMRYSAIPSVIYTNPEVGCVGETEETAKQKGIDYEAVKISMMYSGRYAAENEGGDGICKVIIDKKYRKIIGVHMIGSYASEIIFGAGLMIETEMRVEDVKELVFPHPTVSEIIREAIFEL
jgi:dihydrolipoamide dehydrogenase